ncbi:hypothetical protein SAMN05216255_0175 [Pseudomonas segetis]|uniref:Uncharacterized protein n=1 Tax=Pseudomonas segetis TaxID=298908 RepID=A0A238Z6L2_9PSED|nr:hypothetical protein SAMN05216255_0175 [Pseudomonas segetis]
MVTHQVTEVTDCGSMRLLEQQDWLKDVGCFAFECQIALALNLR